MHHACAVAPVFDALCFTRLTLRAPLASFGLSALPELALCGFESPPRTYKKTGHRGRSFCMWRTRWDSNPR